ncbi:MAG TPA: serine/threonine-protein kinase, partial [Vicinamibacteria bacterium]
AAMDTPPQIGRFRVTGRVGEGAMGVVLRGRDEALDRDVALKIMRAKVADAEDKERFLREARAIARLQHPNIITVYELGEHEGSPFIAMELLEGVDLQRAIEGGLRPNPRANLPIVLQLLAGLGHAHEHGIVHRDVKPSNLFLPRGRPAKIMDFGVARLGGATSTSGLIVGTPNYMSPEQVTAAAVDGRSDLFSAGLILYELVTGEKAFQGDSVVALMYKIAHEDPDLSLIPRGAKWDRLRAVLTRAFFKDAVRRYPTAAAMSADLALALQDLGGSLDDAAASDKGMLRRTASTSAPIVSEERPSTPPAAAPAPAPSSGAGAAAAVMRRPAWRMPAVIGVAVLTATAATMVALLVWPRDESGRPTPAPSARPRDGGGSLVSGGARLASPALPPSPEAPPDRRPTPTPPRATPTPRVVPSAPVPLATAAGDRVTGAAAAGARLERANDLYEKGRYAAALAEAQAVLRGEPGNREARSLVEDIEADIAVASRLKQAQDAMRRGDREEALAQVRAGLAVKSNDGRLLSLFKELTQ